jgi:hypothetical protein
MSAHEEIGLAVKRIRLIVLKQRVAGERGERALDERAGGA